MKVSIMLKWFRDGINAKLVIVTILFVSTTIFSQPTLSKNKIIEANNSYVELPKNLQMKIGKKLYFEKKQGCANCHGISGKGADRAQNVDLTKPSSWKSFKVASVINCQKNTNLGVRTVAEDLILNGAEKWNESFYETIGLKPLSKTVFFDKEMIGIHSTAFKRNVRSIHRVLKKNKLHFKSKIIPKVMAQSVFFYISEQFFPENLAIKSTKEKCEG